MELGFIEYRIKEVLINKFGIDTCQSDAQISKYLDSLDYLEAVMEIEDEFNLTVPVNQNTNKMTLKELAVYIQNLLDTKE